MMRKVIEVGKGKLEEVERGGGRGEVLVVVVG